MRSICMYDILPPWWINTMSNCLRAMILLRNQCRIDGLGQFRTPIFVSWRRPAPLSFFSSLSFLPYILLHILWLRRSTHYRIFAHFIASRFVDYHIPYVYTTAFWRRMSLLFLFHPTFLSNQRQRLQSLPSTHHVRRIILAPLSNILLPVRTFAATSGYSSPTVRAYNILLYGRANYILWA